MDYSYFNPSLVCCRIFQTNLTDWLQ